MNIYTKYDRFQTMSEAVRFLQKYTNMHNVIDYQFLIDDCSLEDSLEKFAPYRYVIIIRFTKKEVQNGI